MAQTMSRMVVTSVTLTFDTGHQTHWSWTENLTLIQWWEHTKKGLTDGETDGQTDSTVRKAAWSQL